MGEDWPSVLDTLAAQEKILNQVVPKSQWGETVAGVRHKPELVTRLKEILGEEEYDTKLKLIGYEGTIDPERILPAVLLHRIPKGIRGLLLVALLAASMSTFDSCVNATTGFFTRDIYQRYYRRKAGRRELNVASYAFGVVLVCFAAHDIQPGRARLTTGRRVFGIAAALARPAC